MSKFVLVLLAVVVSTALSTQVHAQPVPAQPVPAQPVHARPQAAAPNPVVELKHKLMYISGFGGWNGVTLHQNGRELELGFFGGNVGTLFREAPEALQQAESSAAWRKAGWATLTIGFVAEVSGIVISSSAQSGTIQGVAYGSVFGGMAAVLAGAFMIGHANTKLLRAINLYNAHFMNRHLPQEEKVDFKLFLSHRGAGAAVTRTF